MKAADETVFQQMFTPSPVCQIRLPSRLFPWQAGSDVLTVRKADLGQDLEITP